MVILEVEGRKPVAIKAIDCSSIKLNDEGKLDLDDWDRQLHLAVNSLPPFVRDPGTVINASHKFYQKQSRDEFRWEPTTEIVEAIKDSIFPKKGSPLRLV
jgi:hypothetical protein